jgi:hypothetical protein
MLSLFRRASPEEKERQRLEALLLNSRSIEGTLTGVEDSLLFYTYEVGGVTYDASQDSSVLEGAAKALLDVQLGAVTVRYATTNPANSIVLSTGWSGIRGKRKQ